ncbi:anthranilate 1,2-dioxygenase small subunit [Curvibacter sp. RS43]|uniref:anthranilate 1,2-dioxygenase small subunit n=1 Tax=Curvibacter microcysteis TaxID=3026419 RepID=UPI0023602580|nr:anthranilate 1,2-dioxygenase small subunit [Curvibacter sp. RS43]MDD0812699.1 anthranilate 1,2-dioxygenase small subunit [Curvibacter sp. RS43]
MSAIELQHAVEQFLYDQADWCDRQQWDEYLACFDPSAVFHVPQWDSEHVATTDPKREMSMIYYANRGGLEDRIFRLRTGKSAASHPMPRTLHQINNVRIRSQAQGVLQVGAKWSTHYTRHGQADCYFGEVSYELRQSGASFSILRKHVLLLNDRINAVLDFYHL